MANTTTEIAMPGNTASHQAMRISSVPRVSIPPQVGMSGGTPTPRNDRDASIMMAKPQGNGAQHNVTGDHVGQDVLQHDADGTGADGGRRQGIVQFLDAQHLGTNYSNGAR